VSTRLGRLAAGGGLVLSILLKVVAVLLLLATPEQARSSEGLAFLLWAPGVLAFAAVGAIVAWRRPENPIGWAFLGVGLVEPFAILAETYARLGTIGGAGLPVPALVGAIGAAAYTTSTALVIVILLFFPTGRLPSARWRPVLWALVAWLVLVPIVILLAPGPISDTLPVPNPIPAAGLLGEVASALRPWEELSSVPFLLLAGAALIGRWRGASTRERAQLKWFASAAMLLVVAVLVETVRDGGGAGGPLEAVGLLLLVSAVASIPLAAGVAILRYRLYDIDLVIRRTLVYGALVAILGLVYVGLVIGLQAVLVPLTGGDTLPVALSTLAIAALFGPVRARVRALVDRRFYRSRYDAQQIVGSFAGRLRDEVEVEAVGRALLDATGRAVRPSAATIWIRRGSSR
jgi:hypothetical protein